jgi:hypothetical protein
MNFLQTCQKTHLFLRLGGGLPGTLPTTTVGQTDSLGELVQYVIQAWIDIQNMEPEWGFMVQQGTFDTVANQRTYPLSVLVDDEDVPIADDWLLLNPFNGKPSVFKIQSALANQGWVYYWPYDNFRGYWDLSVRPVARPGYFTIWPDKTLEFDATPDAVYTVFCDYKVKPQVFALNTDDPENYPAPGRGLPAAYHDVIVWKAIKYYCLSRSDQGPLEARADREFNRVLSSIKQKYLPRLRW